MDVPFYNFQRTIRNSYAVLAYWALDVNNEQWPSSQIWASFQSPFVIHLIKSSMHLGDPVAEKMPLVGANRPVKSWVQGCQQVTTRALVNEVTVQWILLSTIDKTSYKFIRLPMSFVCNNEKMFAQGSPECSFGLRNPSLVSLLPTRNKWQDLTTHICFVKQFVQWIMNPNTTTPDEFGWSSIIARRHSKQKGICRWEWGSNRSVQV